MLAENSYDAPVDELERKAFLLFRTDSSDDYKRLVIYLVYSTIQRNPGISHSRITFELNKEYLINSNDIEAALGALASAEVFNTVSSYKLAKSKAANKPVVFRVRNKNLVSQWIDKLQSIQHAALEFQAVKV